MNTKRSFLESLNAGRERRSATSLEDISRALEEIESRLEQATQAKSRTASEKSERSPSRGIAQSMERLANEISRNEPSSWERAPRRDLAHELEHSRRQEDEVAFVGRLAGELKALREDTVRAVDRHREDMDRRWQTLEERIDGTAANGHPDLSVLARRLEEISAAVKELPESLSIRSLEDKVRTLAGAMEQVIAQQRLNPDVSTLLDERLDEITRAIAASAPAANAQTFDPEPFERIEARIASLARQVEELVEDRPGADIAEQLSALTQRIDQIARRSAAPDESLERVSQQLRTISEKIDAMAAPVDADAVLGGLEERFARLAELIESHKGETFEHGRALVGDLERRLNDISEKLARLEPEGGADADLMAAIDTRFAELAHRMDHRERDTADAETLRSIESRLEDIAGRIKDASTNLSEVDTDLIRSLETQVASLSDHLSKPGSNVPEFDDLRPRLEQIESTIAENREALFEAARRAAEEAVSAIENSRGHVADTEGLAEEIRALETVARRSDERNTRTFEAIHDTLLKIVGRLGTLEVVDHDEGRPSSPHSEKLALESVPPIETGDDEEPLVDDHEDMDRHPQGEPKGQRSPAEAAAAAAEAALTDGDKEAKQTEGKRSVLGGLTRAFARRERESEPEQRREPDLVASQVPVGSDDGEDAKDINEPLAPGTGAPDLNAIMKRVRDEHGAKQGASSEADTAKSDFIAAARRAAQAAAAEAEILKKSKTDTGKNSGRPGIGQILRGRRKTALMAVAGLAVIAGGFYVAQTVVGGDVPATRVQASAMNGEAERVETSGAGNDMVATAALDDDTPRANGPAATDAANDQNADAKAAAASDMEEVSVPEIAEASPLEASAVAGKADMQEGDEPAATTADPIKTAAAPPNDTPEPRMASASAVDDAAADDAVTGDAAAETRPASAAKPQAGDDEDDNPADLANIPTDAGPIALRDAAANGNPQAMFEIGSRYADGRGVDADMAKAAAWYEKAAERGLAPAQYRIGNLHEKGIGVERDIDEAKQWYEKAAQQGNASAMHNLGVLYAMGSDGEKADNKAAAHWFQKAAERGVKDSQFNLGILSTKGVGVPQDLGEAYKWFALVADKGDSDAAAKRDEIANALDADELDKARAKAELWKPKTLNHKANAVDVPAEWTEGKTTTASIDMEKAVTNIQVILNKNGYDAGPTDGVMGERTRSAIRAFQKDNDMAPTGDLDKQLVQALLENK